MGTNTDCANKKKSTDKHVDWENLHKTTGSWVKETLKRLWQTLHHQPDDPLIRAHQYCLLIAREYIDTAFEAYKAGRFHSGLTCIRTIYEAAITLMWCSIHGKTEERLNIWVKESIRQDKNIAEELSEAYPEDESDDERVGELERQLSEMKNIAEIPSFKQRVDEVADNLPPEEKKTRSSFIYLQYRVLSASDHVNLDFARFYRRVGQAIVTCSRPEMPAYTPWTTIAAVYLLVGTVRRALEWKVDSLSKEFEAIIGPLRA